MTMPTSHTAVQYLVPYPCVCKSIKAQMSNASSPEFGPGLNCGIVLVFVASDVLCGDMSDLANLHQVNLMVTLPCITLLVVLLECFICFHSFLVF